MHVEDEVGGAAVGVFDFSQGGAGAVGDEVCRGGVVGSGEEDLLACGAGFADGGYRGLDCGCPGGDV